MKILVKYDIKKEDIESLLCSIAECGACNYWAGDFELVKSKNKENYLDDMLHYGFTFMDYEEDKKHTVTPEMIKEGLSCMAKVNPSQFANIGTMEADNITADVFLQCVAFKKEIYG